MYAQNGAHFLRKLVCYFNQTKLLICLSERHQGTFNEVVMLLMQMLHEYSSNL